MDTAPRSLSRRELVYRLAAETSLAAPTIARALDGASVRASTLRAVQSAARKLRVSLPVAEPRSAA